MPDSQTITRQSRSNLALAFILLPRAKRHDMSILYAFCRAVDDVADNEEEPAPARRAELAEWRADLSRLFSGNEPRKAVNLELGGLIRRYALPFNYFDEIIRGVEMDLNQSRYQTYAELEEYCFRVASVVGLLSIEIFGYRNPRCRAYAVSLGKALQFTNILRDVKTDAENRRVYFPEEAMAQFGIDPDEILRREYSDRFYRLAADMAGRARAFYQEARASLPLEDRRAMMAAELMGSFYWRLLRQLEARRFNIFQAGPARLGFGQKLTLILRTWYRLVSGTMVPNYGTP